MPPQWDGGAWLFIAKAVLGRCQRGGDDGSGRGHVSEEATVPAEWLAVDVVLLPGSSWRQGILRRLQRERRAVHQDHPLSPRAACNPAEPTGARLSTDGSPRSKVSGKTTQCPLWNGSLRAPPGARLKGACC